MCLLSEMVEKAVVEGVEIAREKGCNHQKRVAKADQVGDSRLLCEVDSRGARCMAAHKSG